MIITGLSSGGGGGDAYAYIKVFDDSATTVCAFIGDKCYGAAKFVEGIAIIPVSKSGTYTIKDYVEDSEGKYSEALVATGTSTITNPREVVSIALSRRYGNLLFGGMTDEQFSNTVSDLDSGVLTTSDLPWAVGDTRTVNLSAMSATGVGESHDAETVTFVIQNVGGVTLTNGKKCHYVVGLLNCLTTTGYMNSSNTNAGSWKSSARRAWCNGVFRNAIPSTIRNCFKQFKCVTATEYNASTTTTTDDYFALPAEKEVFGTRRNSNQTEANVLTQFEWYKTSANRIKKLGNSGSTYWWWERSPHYISSSNFCGVTADGTAAESHSPSDADGLAPFGCI